MVGCHPRSQSLLSLLVYQLHSAHSPRTNFQVGHTTQISFNAKLQIVNDTVIVKEKESYNVIESDKD
jgi:hypothetical protein